MNDAEYEFIKDQAEREARAILAEIGPDFDNVDVLYDVHDPVFAVVLDTVDTSMPDNDIEAVEISDICYEASDRLLSELRYDEVFWPEDDEEEDDDLW